MDERRAREATYNRTMRSPRRLTRLFLMSIAIVLAFRATLAPAPATARVLSIEIDRRVEILPGTPFARTGVGGVRDGSTEGSAEAAQPAAVRYELLEGRVRFGFDPASPANARVTDLDRTPTGRHGLVEAWAEFVVLQPIDPAARRGTALVDVPNRGRRLALVTFNRVAKGFMAPATLDPGSPIDWGDGFLMSQGLSVFWVGWQADAPAFPGAMRLRVPHAVAPDGRTLRGLARSDWVVDEATDRLELAALGHTPHRAADPAAKENRLTRRAGREASREVVPRARWRFDAKREAIESEGGFEPGWIYELVYVAEDPPLVGLGFAAFRDFAAFAENDPSCPFAVERTIAHGLSQSGRFLRHFLYEDFNRDERGRTVFDGMMIEIGGAGRGGFNHRFSHPGRVGNPYANFFYPGDQFPFASRPTQHGETRAGLLDLAEASGSLPKLFQINTGYEYWGRAASLVHMSPDGERDVAPHERERLYHIASAPHYSLPFPPEPRSEVVPGLFLGSSIDTTPIQRALLVHLLRWVESDVAPPPSRIPTIEAGSLVIPDALAYPVSWLTPPRSPHVAYDVDYGPRWPSGIIDRQPPRVGPAFAIRVPTIDALGSEASGIRPLELRVPIGSYTPWALRYGKRGGSDQMAGYIGSFLPLARSDAARRPGDDRPSLATRYPSRDAYETAVAREIDALVEEGYMLPRDRGRAFRRAGERWDWISDRTTDQNRR